MMQSAQRNLFLIIFAVALVVCLQDAVAQSDRIVRFHSEIHVGADGMLEVTETIEIHTAARNSRIRRGIYRDIPLRYRDSEGHPHRVDFELLEVRRNGRPEHWFSERRGDFIRINTGSDHTLEFYDTFAGRPPDSRHQQTFELRYRTGRQLGHYDTHDELYWNVTGNDWVFPIDLATAEVTLPSTFKAEELQLAFYTGAFGASDQNAQVYLSGPGQVRFDSTQALKTREGLTILVGFPKGFVAEPTPRGLLQRLAISVDHLLFFVPHLLALIVSGLSLFVLVFFGLRRGRLMRAQYDPEHAVVIVRYHPHEGYSPAGLREFSRRYDERCLSADLLELARRGVLRILAPGSDANASKQDWLLEAQSETHAESALSPPLKTLFTTLFSGNSQVTLSGEQSALLRRVRKAHRAALINQRPGVRFSDWPTLIFAAMLVLINSLAAFWLLNSYLQIDAVGWLHFGGVVAPGVMIIIALWYGFTSWRRFTAKGWRLINHIDGFTRYLRVAEKSDLERLQCPSDEREPDLTPERFQQLLPYAVALEVADAWTRRFTSAVGAVAAEQAIRQMHWIPMRNEQMALNLEGMTQALMKDFDRSIRTTIHPPGTSSGFSVGGSGGGGGFSGGGGGGGGGGGR